MQRARLTQLATGWRTIAKGPGMVVLEEELGEAVREAVEKLAMGGLSHLQYERLAARIETLLWLRQLPAARWSSYDDALKQLTQPTGPAKPAGPEGPVPWGEDEEAEEPE